MKKLMMLAAVAAVSFASIASQATVDCTKSDKGMLYTKRNWNDLKPGVAAKPAQLQKAVATKKVYKKGVQ